MFDETPFQHPQSSHLHLPSPPSRSPLLPRRSSGPRTPSPPSSWLPILHQSLYCRGHRMPEERGFALSKRSRGSQSTYQVTAILVFHFLSCSIFGISYSEHGNTVNCRGFDNKLNILEGTFGNKYSTAITPIDTSPCLRFKARQC